MAKLYFKYGAMNSGKSTALMQVAHNYEERDQKVLVIKSTIDTKGKDTLVSRIGITRKVDKMLTPDDDVIDYYKEQNHISCIIVDEAQFLDPKQVEQLWIISKFYNTPVICYGLRSDFQTNGFKGSIRLMELADELDELVTICRCGKTARFNARIVNGKFVKEGDQIAIDGNRNIEYESLCGECYLKKVKLEFK